MFFFQVTSPVVFVHTDAFSSGNEFLHFGDPVILSSDLKWQDNMELVAIYLLLKTEKQTLMDVQQLCYLLFGSATKCLSFIFINVYNAV